MKRSFPQRHKKYICLRISFLLSLSSILNKAEVIKPHYPTNGIFVGVSFWNNTQAGAKVSNRTLANTTFSFSNMVGPLEEVEFYGHPIVYLAPSVYGHPHALTIHFQSYVEKMKVVVAVDETIIPDPHNLCEDFATSLEQIKTAVAKKVQS